MEGFQGGANMQLFDLGARDAFTKRVSREKVGIKAAVLTLCCLESRMALWSRAFCCMMAADYLAVVGGSKAPQGYRQMAPFVSGSNPKWRGCWVA